MKRDLLIDKANNINMGDFKTKKQAIAYIIKLNNIRLNPTAYLYQYSDTQN